MQAKFKIAGELACNVCADLHPWQLANRMITALEPYTDYAKDEHRWLKSRTDRVKSASLPKEAFIEEFELIYVRRS